MQCGYCISGMLISTVALLAQTPYPTETETSRQQHGVEIGGIDTVEGRIYRKLFPLLPWMLA